MNYINRRISFANRILLLLCSFGFCFCVGSVLLVMLIKIFGATASIMRISIILQNFVVMILPALITALLVSKNVVSFFCIGKFPSIKMLGLLICTIVVSTPIMNWIVAWNESIHLPESLSAIENYLRALEDAAAETTSSLLNNESIYSLIITVLAVGIFTGFSEEMLFRGTLQRILQSRPMNIHLAIWITAFIFSFMHFQFYGFVPRMLLGAFFGYLLWWTKSLWAPIIAHSINNSVVVINAYICGEGTTESNDAIGVSADGGVTLITILSVLATAVLIYLFVRLSNHEQKADRDEIQ